MVKERNRHARRVALAVLMLGFLIPTSGARPGQEEKEDEEPRALTDSEARDLLVKENLNLKSREVRLRVEALERLAQHSSEKLITPLVKALKDKEEKVVIAACRALGSQPYKKAQTTLLKLLKNRKFTAKTSVEVAVIEALGKVGWSPSGYDKLRDYFDHGSREAKRAVLLTFGRQKEKRAFSLFADHLEAPAPSNPNSPSNPPPSFWKQKYKEWKYYRYQASKGMEMLTGRKFEKKQEAIDWAKEGPGRKLGYKYRSGS